MKTKTNDFPDSKYMDVKRHPTLRLKTRAQVRQWIAQHHFTEVIKASLLDARIDKIGYIDMMRRARKFGRDLALAQEKQLLAVISGK